MDTLARPSLFYTQNLVKRGIKADDVRNMLGGNYLGVPGQSLKVLKTNVEEEE